jgi:hypothetical protein
VRTGAGGEGRSKKGGVSQARLSNQVVRAVYLSPSP